MLRLVKRFVHRDGRKILAFATGDGGWIVEVRPADDLTARSRWYPADRAEAAAVVAWLIEGDESWTDASWQ